MKKLSLGKILALCWIFRIVGFAVFLGGFLFLEYKLPLVCFLTVGLGIAILIAGVCFELSYYCCPHCGTWIGLRNLPYGYCRCCGKELDVKPEDSEE